MKLIESGYTPNEDNLVGTGTDSKVYRHGKYVVKVYKDLSAEKLTAYQELTNAASDVFKKDPEINTFTLDNETWGVDVVINPIIGVNLSSPRLSVSEYVPGPMLGLIGSPTLQHAPIQELENPEERAALSSLTEGFFSKKSNYHLRHSFTLSILNRVSTALDVWGLYQLSPVNIKTRADADERRLQLVVTDLGNSIEDIRFPAH